MILMIDFSVESNEMSFIQYDEVGTCVVLSLEVVSTVHLHT